MKLCETCYCNQPEIVIPKRSTVRWRCTECGTMHKKDTDCWIITGEGPKIGG
jgi:NMD protein affecting ribosome stability and mRNA decay